MESSSYGGRAGQQANNGRKRKGADEYVAENADDFEARTIFRDGEKVRVIVCRFCCQAIGARSDRIKEHLSSKRHIHFKSGLGSPEESGRSSVSSPRSNASIPLSPPAELTPKTEPQLQSIPQLRLKWPGNEKNRSEFFAKLRQDKKLTDVTLWIENNKIDCHKIVLCAGSTYFEQILMNDSAGSKATIFVCGLEFWQVKTLVDFIYSGEVCIGQDKLQDLLAAAEHLRVKGLAKETGRETKNVSYPSLSMRSSSGLLSK